MLAALAVVGGERHARDLGGLSIDAERLAPMVRTALDSPTARVLDWDASQLRAGAGNPTSGGLYRVAGQAEVDRLHRPWSMVLKVFQSPASVGWVDFGDEPGHWNYWLRELRAFRSGLLADLPGGVLAPRHYGSRVRGQRAWLWLEDIGPVERSAWTAQACRRAARHLGAFEGHFLARRPFRRRSWLANSLLRSWSPYATAMLPALRTMQSADGAYARLRRSVGSQAIDHLVESLAAPGPLLDALERLPHALSHQDANIDNLQLRRTPDGESRLMALDWQLMGVGPVGAVVGELLNSLGDAAGPRVWAEEESVLAAYTDGLTEAGAPVDADEARLAYVASSVLRQGVFMFSVLGRRIGELREAADEAAVGAHLAEFAAANEHMLARLVDFAGETRSL